jgi:hypothetical protein
MVSVSTIENHAGLFFLYFQTIGAFVSNAHPGPIRLAHFLKLEIREIRTGQQSNQRL